MSALGLIVLAPLLTAALTAALGKERTLAVGLSVLGSLLSLGITASLALAPVRQTLLAEVERLLPGPAFGSIDIPLTIGMTPATGAIAITVAAVVAAVQLVGAWYLAQDERRVGFHATVSLFAAAMLLVVISGDLVLTIIGWEVMGWCSWLLIGHSWHRLSAREAARKAFLVTRVADAALIAGAVSLIAATGTSSFEGIARGVAQPSCGVELALVGIVIGVLGKSAQLPFSDWLPDAMVGPTPASALIHAATMVAAGSLVLASLGPVLAVTSAAKMVLLISVGATMIFGAAMALFQSDIKRLLAWSTVSQIALMLAPLALLTTSTSIAEPIAAGQFHLYAHAIFKALLFLTIAWLAIIGGGTSAQALRGSGRTHRLAQVAWIAGLASLAGLPFVVGGVSKEHLFEIAHLAGGALGWALLALLAVTTVLTAAYSTRAYVVVMDRAGRDTARPRAPMALIVALGLLAVASVLGAVALLTGRFIGVGISWPMIALTLPLVLLGALIGARWCWRLPERWTDAADTGLGADRLFRGVGRATLGLARSIRAADERVLNAPVRLLEAGGPALSVRGQRLQGHYRPNAGLLALGVGLVVLGMLAALLVGAGPIIWGALT